VQPLPRRRQLALVSQRRPRPLALSALLLIVQVLHITDVLKLWLRRLALLACSSNLLSAPKELSKWQKFKQKQQIQRVMMVCAKK
jgi:hypothetical protein